MNAAALFAKAKTHQRELQTIGLGHLFALAGNFAGVKLLTHFLQPDAYGELALGMTAAGLLTSIACSPVANAMLRFYPIHAADGTLAVHVSAFRRLSSALSAGAILLSAIAAVAIGFASEAHWGLLVFGGGIYAVGSGLALFDSTYSTAIRKRSALVVYQAIDACGRPLFALAAILLFGRRGAIAIGGYAIAGLLNSRVQKMLAARTPALRDVASTPPPSGERLRALVGEALRHTAPMSFAALFTAVSAYGDRWTLQGLFGPADLGLYAALCQIGVLPSALVSGLVGAFMLPICFERAGSLTERGQVRAATRVIIWTALVCAASAAPVIVFFAAAGTWIMSLLTNRDYLAHANQLWIVGLAGYFLAVGRIALVSVEVLRKTSQQSLPWVVNAVVTVALSLLLGSRWGIDGIVLALLLSNLSFAVASVWIAWRLTRSRLNALPA